MRDGVGEDIHLVAGVVDVELARNVIAGKREHVGHRVSKRRPTPVPEVHGPGRVRGDELEVNLHAIARMRPAVRGVLGADLLEHVLQGGIGELDVDEAGAGDLDALDCGAFHVAGDDLGDLSGVHVRLLGELQGDGGCPVAVLEVTRTLDARGGQFGQGKLSALNGLAQG